MGQAAGARKFKVIHYKSNVLYPGMLDGSPEGVEQIRHCNFIGGLRVIEYRAYFESAILP